MQTCIVHLIRHSLKFVSWKDRKAVVPELRRIYRATDAEACMAALNAFEAGPWGRKYPVITMSWRRNWDRVIPFFAFPEAVRRIVYTTNATEAFELQAGAGGNGLGATSPMTTRRPSCYTSSSTATAAEWKRPSREWGEARTQFAITFGERFKAN